MLNFFGFDHDDPYNLGWTGSLGRSNSTFRNGTHALSLFTAAEAAYGLPANYATLYCGFAYYTPSLAAGGKLFSYVDGSTEQITVTCETNGTLKVRRGGAGGTVLATSSAGVMTTNAWRHITLIVTFHGSNGAVDLKVDSVTVASATGVNTSQSGNAYANKIHAQACASGLVNAYLDDLWISDAANQGDCKVETIYPVAAGNATQLTPSAGNNYQCVDEAGSPNDDTDYVSGSGVGDKDLYQMGNLTSTNGTVKGVKISHRSRKDDAGTRQVSMVVRTQSTNSVRTAVTLGTSYATSEEVLTQEPADSSSWQISDVNGMELGVQIAA